ncbi:MAG: hypothetical protein LC102_06810 [Ignavibacteriales bacterium]|nr:hypothetical protein [Ignavibacteria bacterium]MBZ0198143.1 hypothetical protein [Ignavibacteriaceae bacterium]MCZ2143120.1 hypothetical protein [Ignavibacteriales bacterium]WKZ72551.1 MAG: hypothetical protein QY308_13125 [Ignavibacteriaceae bacterium]
MKKPGSFLGLTLAMGIILSFYLAKKTEGSSLITIIVLVIAFLVGLFFEYRTYGSKKK